HLPVALLVHLAQNYRVCEDLIQCLHARLLRVHRERERIMDQGAEGLDHRAPLPEHRLRLGHLSALPMLRLLAHVETPSLGESGVRALRARSLPPGTGRAALLWIDRPPAVPTTSGRTARRR